MERAEKIFWIKHRLGITQTQLAQMAGVHFTLVSKWAKEQRNSDRIAKIVDSLVKKAA